MIGGIASSAYGYGPDYGYYGGYAPAYYGGYGYDGYGPGYSSAGYYDEGYVPAYRYRRVIRPAFAYYGGLAIPPRLVSSPLAPPLVTPAIKTAFTSPLQHRFGGVLSWHRTGMKPRMSRAQAQAKRRWFTGRPKPALHGLNLLPFSFDGATQPWI